MLYRSFVGRADSALHSRSMRCVRMSGKDKIIISNCVYEGGLAALGILHRQNWDSKDEKKERIKYLAVARAK